MPFFKRLVEPRSLCRRADPDHDEAGGSPLQDLLSVSHVALARSLRQLSDLAKHACSVFQELEGDLVATGRRLRGLQRKVGRLQETCCRLDPRQEPVPVSDLDAESKLTWHYRAPWHKQRNVLRPTTRPPCVEQLHRDAHPGDLHADGRRRRSSSRGRRVTLFISALPSVPASPTTPAARKARKGPRVMAFPSSRPPSPTECCHFSPWNRKAATSDPASPGQRSKALPVPNTPTTLDKQTNWSRALPLPTPEERMKCDSRGVASCVVPINVTGAGFDRDAGARRSLVHSQSLLQRRRKLRRRRTLAGVPGQLRDFAFDSDDSPGSRERGAIVRAGSDVSPSDEDLANHLVTRDSGCQTEDFLISGAPSRRRIRAQRGQQGAALCFSRSAGDIAALRDVPDDAFAARQRTRSLPRDGSRTRTDEDEDVTEFSALNGEEDLIPKDEEESADEQAGSGQLSTTPERVWAERARSRPTRTGDAGSCDASSGSDTFGSPAHSVSAAGVLGGPADHKDDHQSSSGNWSGSSSTCPSQTSETLAPGTSPLARCDSELSLNTAGHPGDDHPGFTPDPYAGLRTRRVGSFSSTAMDILEEAGAWNYSRPDPPGQPRDLSPESNREAGSSLGCPSFASMATCESSFSDKPPSEKADTASHYSEDTEGYYTSMHFDCGLKGSRSFTYFYSDHAALGPRCLSLRKPKAKPRPPRRSSSLRTVRDEDGVSDLGEKNLQLVLSGSSGHMAKEVPGVWEAGGSLELPYLDIFGSAAAHSFKDEGVVQADYADLWLLNDLKSSDPYRSLSNSSTATGTTVVECVKSQDSSESQASRSGSGDTTPSLTPAEGDFKLAGLASPSSGYSSQSETPTSAFFPGPLSPSSAKRKPKVPERKSSLASKPEPEVPVVPSSRTDSGAFCCVADDRTPIQDHQRVAESPTGPSLNITVQLRSIRKELHPDPDDGSCSAATCRGAFANRAPSELNSRRSAGLDPPRPSDEELVNGQMTAESAAASPAADGEAREDAAEEDLGPSAPSPPAAPDRTPVADPGSCDGNRDPASPENPAGNREEESGAEENPGQDSTSPPSAEGQAGDDDDGVFLSPARSRTTDDLFAAIHRSKRKVLGRKESGELPARNGPSSSGGPTTPPPGAVRSPGPATSPSGASPSGPQRAPGAICRNVKKSSTSNEEFKLLLLKKGSRSESGYRMSAAEILKSPVSPKGHPPGEQAAAEPLEAEGSSPKASASPCSSRTGRARIPPPANSSRYAARARFYSAPMQAISEGEAENSDGGPHDDEPPPHPHFA
ncbi:actin remodeling regulator NHS-like isoform X2 [Syngnathoides biaculeatus]|uniref:actin remodeling regulator NHS-like isoform X2 n=1 Tax=Syngnathoides biaculeatus TaxID=300417 RepID=UPI002ADDFDC6|nr:actin remodeling regulator NHS-like isoform X2 [Syngnathoides biaculeatus]